VNLGHHIKKRLKVIIQMNIFLALKKELILFSTELPTREIKFEGWCYWALIFVPHKLPFSQLCCQALKERVGKRIWNGKHH